MPDRIFESKEDWWLVAFVWAALALGPTITVVAAFVDWPGWPVFVVTLAACLVGPAIVFVLACPVRYILSGDTLLIRSGLVLRWRVPIGGIEAIEPSRTMLASPAWSLDRIRITYRDRSAGKQELVISPQAREAFYEAVLERAPGLRREGRGLSIS
jgi:hypothetical protein